MEISLLSLTYEHAKVLLTYFPVLVLQKMLLLLAGGCIPSLDNTVWCYLASVSGLQNVQLVMQVSKFVFVPIYWSLYK